MISSSASSSSSSSSSSSASSAAAAGAAVSSSSDLVTVDQSDALADEDVAEQWEQPKEGREGALLVEGDPVNVVDLRRHHKCQLLDGFCLSCCLLERLVKWLAVGAMWNNEARTFFQGKGLMAHLQAICEVSNA